MLMKVFVVLLELVVVILYFLVLVVIFFLRLMVRFLVVILVLNFMVVFRGILFFDKVILGSGFLEIGMLILRFELVLIYTV